MSSLDRALCERLQIPPQIEARHEFFDHAGDGPIPCICGATFGDAPKHERCPERTPIYPALSTTGDGMVLLMEALEKHGWDWDARNGREPARVTFGVFCIALFAEFPQERRQHYATSASAPMALAMAAAAALGIEVQP